VTRPRTRLRRLIGRVGPEAYEAAVEHAWRTAAGTGRGEGARPRSAEDRVAAAVIHELAEAAAYSWPISGAERVALLVALYRQLPSYAVLMHAGHAYRDLEPEARPAFWAAYRALLDDPDDRLADPVAYSLWCDYFEAPDDVEVAWTALTGDPGLGRRGTERLLGVAGPVPWALKAPLYERLWPDRAWHRALLESLSASRFDVRGQVDPGQALSLLDRLRLGADTPGLAELRRALAQPAAPARRRRAPITRLPRPNGTGRRRRRAPIAERTRRRRAS
jgi:hypothetical protein